MLFIRKRNTDDVPAFVSNWLDHFLSNDESELVSNCSCGCLPAVNISEHEKELRLELAAPGLKKEDFKISLENNLLTISVDREESKEEVTYLKKEYNFYSFTRSFALSENVDADKISASYENGVLNIAVPKKEEVKIKPKEIAIS